MRNDILKLGLLKKALPHIPFWQMPDVWRRHNLMALNTESEGLTEELSFAVNRRGRLRTNARPLVAGQRVVDVVINNFGRHVHGAEVAERLPDRLQMRSKLRQGAAAVELVIFLK